MTEKNIIWKEIDGVKRCYDENNNCCSVEYWGSEEKALEALRSLKNCSNCFNCSDCFKCSNCSNCGGCSDCSYQQNKENPKFETEKKIEEIKQEISKDLQDLQELPRVAVSSFGIASEDHQAKIHNEILEDLKYVGISDDETVGYDLAKEIVKAIAKGQIRNLKINY